MAIKEGDAVEYDGEGYTVVKIYSTLGLMQSSALLKSKDGERLLMIGVGLLNNSSLYPSKKEVSPYPDTESFSLTLNL